MKKIQHYRKQLLNLVLDQDKVYMELIQLLVQELIIIMIDLKQVIKLLVIAKEMNYIKVLIL